jgi:uncharacterized circularly permuted ATP-grasp superfamily protein
MFAGIFLVRIHCAGSVALSYRKQEITKRIFPEMFSANNVSMVVNYPMILHNILVSLSRNISKPNVV